MAENPRRFKVNNGWLAILLALGLIGAVAVTAWLLRREVLTLRAVGLESRRLEAREAAVEASRRLPGRQTGGGLNADRAAVTAYFLGADSLSELIEFLEKLAAARGVKLALTGAALAQGGGPSAGRAGESARLTLSAEAPFPRLFQFLAQVDAAPYLVSFEQAAFGAGEKSWRGALVLEARLAPPLGAAADKK